MPVTIYGSGQTIVQVVQGINSTVSTATPGAFTFTDLVSATITPRNPSNNILIIASLNYWTNNYGANRLVQSINGGGFTVCANSVSRSSYGGTHMGGNYNNGNGPGGLGAYTNTISMLVTPGAGTTSFQVKAQAAPNSGGSIYICQASASDMGSGPCTIQLIEVTTV